jgi:hypothetical protein
MGNAGNRENPAETRQNIEKAKKFDAHAKKSLRQTRPRSHLR